MNRDGNPAATRPGFLIAGGPWLGFARWGERWPYLDISARMAPGKQYEIQAVFSRYIFASMLASLQGGKHRGDAAWIADGF
jgi:hypothetical protein